MTKQEKLIKALNKVYWFYGNVLEGNITAVKLLLVHNADINFKDDTECSISELAKVKERGNQGLNETVALLEKNTFH